MPTMDFFSGREYEPDNEPVKKPSHDLPSEAENEAKNDSTPSMTMDFFASEEPKAQETPGRTLGDFFAERAETRRQEQENEELSTEFPAFDLSEADASGMPKNKEPLNGYQPLSFGFEDEEDHDDAASAFSFENAQPVKEDAEEEDASLVNHFDAEPKSEAFDFGGKSDKTANDESFDFGILEKGLDDDMKEFDFGPAEQETPKKKFDFDAPDNTATQSTQNEFNFAALDDRPSDNDGEKETLSFNFASAPEESPFDLGKDPFSIGSKEAADTTVAFNFASEKTDDLFQNDAPTRVTPVPAQTPAPQKPDALNGYQPLSFDFGEENAAEEKRETVSAPMQKEPAHVTPVPPAPEMPKNPMREVPNPAAQAKPQEEKKPLPVQPVRTEKEEPTLAFTPASAQNTQEEPTVAFTPVGAQKPAQDAPKESAPNTAKQTSARAEKEKDIGAAVFSALMADENKDTSYTYQMHNPMPRRKPKKPTAPQPIDWHALDHAIDQAADKEKPQQKADVSFDSSQATPIEFDLGDTDAADSDIPDFSMDMGSFGSEPETDDFSDLFDQDNNMEEERAEHQEPRRRPNSNHGGGRPPQGGRPRKPAARKQAGHPNNSIFAWIALIVIALVVVFAVIFTGGDDKDKDHDKNSSSGTSTTVSDSTQETPDTDSGAQTDDSATEPVDVIPRGEWFMVLANRSSVLPADFAVQTVKVGGVEVDSRIEEPLKNMISAAEQEGIKLKPVNGYRSMKWQTEKWDARVKSLMTENNLSKEEAEKKAIDFTSAPGTSDHNTGLGIDIVSEDHESRDAAFADTKAAKWLEEHAVQYGFIQRYPSNKTEETGMNYEPWHYRYVGPEQALKIKESGLCLEEYLK